MARSVSRHSLFSQRLDRAVFAAYFIGGIAPLIALALIIDRWVLPQVEGVAQNAWLAGLVSLGILSLAVYFALRHITSTAVARMDQDNDRLQSLLAASAELAGETHGEATLSIAANRAREVVGAHRLAIYQAAAADKDLELHSTTDAKSREWASGVTSEHVTLIEEALETGQPSLGADGSVAIGLRGGTAIRAGMVLDGPDGADTETVSAVATIARIAGTAIERGDLQDAQRNFFAHVTDLLVSALDAHVVGRQGHAMQTARLCNRIAHQVGLEATQIERLHWGAMLHDLGMLKTEPGRHMDMKAVRLHPVIGARMLERIRLWEPVAPLVHSHHEWFDGSGYPEGKAGEDIPLEARIIGLADAVDAMARSEADKVGLSLPEIVDEVRRCSGTQFDPVLVEAFVELAERGEIDV